MRADYDSEANAISIALAPVRHAVPDRIVTMDVAVRAVA